MNCVVGDVTGVGSWHDGKIMRIRHGIMTLSYGAHAVTHHGQIMGEIHDFTGLRGL